MKVRVNATALAALGAALAALGIRPIRSGCLTLTYDAQARIVGWKSEEERGIVVEASEPVAPQGQSSAQ